MPDPTVPVNEPQDVEAKLVEIDRKADTAFDAQFMSCSQAGVVNRVDWAVRARMTVYRDALRAALGAEGQQREKATSAWTMWNEACHDADKLGAELAAARQERDAVRPLLGYLRDVAQGRVRYLDRGVVLSLFSEVEKALASPAPDAAG